MLTISPRIQISMDEFEFTSARSGGPGGQNVNKVSSKAQLRWPVARTQSLPPDVLGRFLNKYASRLTADGDLIITSQKYRDLPRNKEDCLQKLKELITSVVSPPKRRRPTKPTAASVKKRMESKRHKSAKKKQRRPPAADD